MLYIIINIWEKKNLFTTKTSQKKSFAVLLNVCGILTNVSNLMGNSWLINILLVCFTEHQLSSTTVLRNGTSTYEIVRNDDHFDKFKSLAVLYNKHNFKCLEQENFDGVIYIKFSSTICNLINFSTLAVYRKNNLNIAQFVGYIIYVAIAKHVDLILGDFNEDSISKDPIKRSLKSVGFSRIVSEAANIRGV